MPPSPAHCCPRAGRPGRSRLDPEPPGDWGPFPALLPGPPGKRDPAQLPPPSPASQALPHLEPPAPSSEGGGWSRLAAGRLREQGQGHTAPPTHMASAGHRHLWPPHKVTGGGLSKAVAARRPGGAGLHVHSGSKASSSDRLRPAPPPRHPEGPGALSPALCSRLGLSYAQNLKSQPWAQRPGVDEPPVGPVPGNAGRLSGLRGHTPRVAAQKYPGRPRHQPPPPGHEDAYVDEILGVTGRQQDVAVSSAGPWPRVGQP